MICISGRSATIALISTLSLRDIVLVHIFSMILKSVQFATLEATRNVIHNWLEQLSVVIRLVHSYPTQ